MWWALQALLLNWAGHCAALAGHNLRIVPLGDSITVGLGSSTYDGYRRILNFLLDGNQVNYIGYRTSGIGRDINIQARGGSFINDIQNFVHDTYSSKPNVYLIHAGTNNIAATSVHGKECATGNPGCQQAADELGSLIDSLTGTGACVIIAKIVPGDSPNFGGAVYTRNIEFYNSLVEKVVRARDYPGTGYRLQLVDMQQPTEGVTLADISIDGVHPADSGYTKMANIWLAGLNNASAFGLIPALNPSTGYATEPCTIPFSSGYSNGQIVAPRGAPNVFVGVTCLDATIRGTDCECTDEVGTFIVPKVGSCKEMSLQFTTAVQWADLNGDGRPENVWIDQNGAVNVSLSLSSPSNNNMVTDPLTLRVTFRELGLIVPDGVSTLRYKVRLADMNADARAEYLVVAYNGAVVQYTNTGSMHTFDDTISINWNSTGTQITSGFGLSGVGVKLVDWDGDGRADYVWVSADGSDIQVWLNKASGADVNVIVWVSQGTVGPVLPPGARREFIVLADVDADGRADVLVVDQSDGSVTAWLNKNPGSGGGGSGWRSAGMIVSPSQALSVGGGGFLTVSEFGDPDADGAFDYVVTNGGDSSVHGFRNFCVPDAN